METATVVDDGVGAPVPARAAAVHGPDARGAPRAGVWDRRADGTPVRLVPDPAVGAGGSDVGRTSGVWAAGCAAVPGAPAGDCLVGDAGEIVRRVWGVPPGWAALSDDALLALLARPRRDG
ncbi:hypothetical protein tb265_48300 [Gemmatimonadetes bacterium T265]|nr:hypothetical protein tb265_48300 [Gemmatimonadetes bacterium T265]